MLKIFDNVKTIIILCFILILVICYGTIRSNKIEAKNRNEAQILNEQITKENIKQKNVKESLPSITCWGDSLTAGAGGDGVSYPNVLEKLIRLKVYNMGVGGEKTNTILCRQGSRQMMVNNITIPSTTNKIEVGKYNDFYDNYGQVIQPLRQGKNEISCSINGIEGVLTSSQTNYISEDLVYYFQRLKPGEELDIKESTPIVIDGIEDLKDDITIIFIGQNGGYNDINDLVEQQKAMINYTGHDKYIILGLTTGTSDERRELEDRMSQEYGNKYINLREYLSSNGMSDAGLDITDTDKEQMNKGQVPDSLRVDNVHGNSYFYKLIGQQVYDKIIELNYLSDEQKEYLRLK